MSLKNLNTKIELKNKMKLKQAVEILQDASAVVWEHSSVSDYADHLVCYPSLRNLEGIDKNEFLILKAFDDDGRECSVEFTEGDNQEVKVVGSSMFLIDSNENEIQISILTPQVLEEPPIVVYES